MEVNFPALPMTAEQFIGLLDASTQGLGWKVVTYPTTEWKARHPDAQPKTRVDLVSSIVSEEHGALTVVSDETFRFEIIPTGPARIAIRAKLRLPDAINYFRSRLGYIAEKCPEAKGNWWIGPRKPIEHSLSQWLVDADFETLRAAVSHHITAYGAVGTPTITEPERWVFVVTDEPVGEPMGEIEVRRRNDKSSELEARMYRADPLTPNRDEINRKHEGMMMHVFKYLKYRIESELAEVRAMQTKPPQAAAGAAAPGVVFDQRGAIVNQTVFATGSQQVNQSGEVNVNSGRDTTVGGDVTGRDKVSSGME
jgi:hypothetical protein